MTVLAYLGCAEVAVGNIAAQRTRGYVGWPSSGSAAVGLANMSAGIVISDCRSGWFDSGFVHFGKNQ